MGSTNRFSTSTTVVPAAQEEGLLTNLASQLTVSWRLHPVSFSRSLLTAHDGTLDDHASSTRVAACVMGRKAKAQIHNRECALSRRGPAGDDELPSEVPVSLNNVSFRVCEVARTENTRRSCNFTRAAVRHARTLVAEHRKRTNFPCRAPPLSSASSSQATGFGRRVTPLTSPAAVTLACTHSRALFLNWAMSLAACLVWTV